MSESRRNRRKAKQETSKKQTKQESYLDNIDRIVEACKDIAKSWSLNYITLNVFEELIGLSKINLKTDTEDKGFNESNKVFLRMLDKWYDVLKLSSDKLDTNRVSIAHIELSAIELQRLIKEATPIA